MELIANRIAATCMVLVRPQPVGQPPAIQAPAAEPSSAIATTNPIWTGPTRKCFWIRRQRR